MNADFDPHASRLLRDLLLKLSSEEVRMLLTDIGGRHLPQQINWNSSAESVAFNVVELLENRKLIDEAFVSELYIRLKRWSAEISKLELLYRIGPIRRKIALLEALHHSLFRTKDPFQTITLIGDNFDLIFPAREDTHQSVTEILIKTDPHEGSLCFQVVKADLLGTAPAKGLARDRQNETDLRSRVFVLWVVRSPSTPLLKHNQGAATLSDELMNTAQKLLASAGSIARPIDEVRFNVFAGSRRALEAEGQTPTWVRVKDQHPYQSVHFKTTESLLEKICASLVSSYGILPGDHPVRLLFSAEQGVDSARSP